MSGDDWAVGDLALCVKAAMECCETAKGHYHQGNPALAVGRVYRVASVGLAPDFSSRAGRCRCPSLGFEASAGIASRFRKIKPLSDEERDSFLADLREPVFASSLPAAETIRQTTSLPAGLADAVLGERFHTSEVTHP